MEPNPDRLLPTPDQTLPRRHHRTGLRLAHFLMVVDPIFLAHRSGAPGRPPPRPHPLVPQPRRHYYSAACKEGSQVILGDHVFHSAQTRWPSPASATPPCSRSPTPAPPSHSPPSPRHLLHQRPSRLPPRRRLPELAARRWRRWADEEFYNCEGRIFNYLVEKDPVSSQPAPVRSLLHSLWIWSDICWSGMVVLDLCRLVVDLLVLAGCILICSLTLSGEWNPGSGGGRIALLCLCILFFHGMIVSRSPCCWSNQHVSWR
jgi:hypothetical protein